MPSHGSVRYKFSNRRQTASWITSWVPTQLHIIPKYFLTLPNWLPSPYLIPVRTSQVSGDRLGAHVQPIGRGNCARLLVVATRSACFTLAAVKGVYAPGYV